MDKKEDVLEVIFVGLLMGLDVLAIYTFLPNVKRKLSLSLWTAGLHMLFPFLGYELSNIFLAYFSTIASSISIILLFCIGLELLFSAEDEINVKIAPLILAISVSLDTFSVSVSFGILNLHKHLFILCAGLSAFICSYVALSLSHTIIRVNRKRLNRFVGIVLIIISIWTFINSK